ncbi:MAG TPA: flagellar assembly protein FliW [Pirellulaceae bacterium]|nr:flagellar assembly protein FliW [Pirellulaceae bacterium]
MLLHTTRFGTLQVETDDVFLFPNGLIGLEDFRRWVLLADAGNDAVGWLQSTSHADVAVAVVSPRRFVPDYQVRIPRGEFAQLQLAELDRAFVLTLVSRNHHGLTLNLKAPVLFNLDRRLACQVVTSDDQPLQWDLAVPILKMRQSA